MGGEVTFTRKVINTDLFCPLCEELEGGWSLNQRSLRIAQAGDILHYYTSSTLTEFKRSGHVLDMLSLHKL